MGGMLKKLSLAAVVIGALRVKVKDDLIFLKKIAIVVFGPVCKVILISACADI